MAGGRVQPPVGEGNQRRNGIDVEVIVKVRGSERRVKIEAAKIADAARQEVPAKFGVGAHERRQRHVHGEHHSHEAAGPQQPAIRTGPGDRLGLCGPRQESAPSKGGQRADDGQDGRHGPQANRNAAYAQPENHVKQDGEREGEGGCPPGRFAQPPGQQESRQKQAQRKEEWKECGHPKCVGRVGGLAHLVL